MRALFANAPLDIQGIFFDRSDFKFHSPPPEIEEKEFENILLPDTYATRASVDYINDDASMLQVTVAVKSMTSKDKISLTEFEVKCVGLYSWDPKVINLEEKKKQVFSWTASIQMGAIRQHIIDQTAKGPFRTPFYLPVLLVRIEEDNEAQSKKAIPKSSKK